MTNGGGPQATDSPPGDLPGALATGSPAIPRPLLERAEWSERLELGIPQIDGQHRRFFELAASFGRDQDEIRLMKTLVILSNYIRTHFREEEVLMRNGGFPGREAHCRLHAQFRQMLADLIGRARTMSLDEIAEEVRYLINGWFSHHIVTVDAEYAPYVVPDEATARRRSAG